MLKIRYYVLIAILVFVVTFLSALPASLLTKYIPSDPNSGFELKGVTGTIWDGQLQALLQGELVTLSWDMNVWQLFLLNLAADIEISNFAGQLTAFVEVGSKKLSISEGNGSLTAEGINKILSASNLNGRTEQGLSVQDFAIKRVDGIFEEADGELNWKGGPVQAGDNSVELPAIQASLLTLEEGLGVIFFEAQSNKVFAEADLSHDGRGHLKFKERVVRFVNIPEKLRKGDPESIIFEIKQEVFHIENGW